MKTFKKLSALILALMMTFTLFACDSKETEDDGEKSSKSTNANSPEGAVKKYFKSIVETDTEAYIELMPESHKWLYKKYYANGLEGEVQYDLESTLEDLEAYYGNDIKIEVKNIDTEEMSSKSIKTIKEGYASNSSLDPSSIEDGAEITFDLFVEGDDYDYESEGSASLIKEEGIWKIYEIEYDI